jgi:CRISPR-associated protein Csm3
MKQIQIKELAGKIRVETGLHIGSGSDVIEIGGMDNPIVKNPTNDEPYIPGSSLKGKMRSLMEWFMGKVTQNNGKPCNCGECPICTVFGCASVEEKTPEKAMKRGPTRLIMRDAPLTAESRANHYNGNSVIEEKYENTINRITAEATPRPLERIVPGTEFDFSLSYRVIDINGDNGKQDLENFENVVIKALALLEHDYLGGGGSRGNGKIKFVDLRDETGKEINLNEVKI